MRKSVSSKRSHRILWVVLLVLLALLVVLAAVFAAKRFGDAGGETLLNASPDAVSLQFELDPGVSYSHAVTEDKLFFYSAENIKIVNNNGELEEDISLPLSRPFLVSKGRYALIADKGGKKAYLFRGGKQETVFELPGAVIAASVNPKGSCVFVMEGETNKCSVSVESAKGEELFRWNSGGLYVLDADISDDGENIAVSSLNTDGGVLQSNVILFNIHKETPTFNDAYEDEIFAAVRFHGSTLYCIGESAAYVYSGYKKLNGKIDYEGRELLNYCADGDVLALLFAGTGLRLGSGDLETYNTRGDRLGQFHYGKEVAFLDASGGRIALGSGRVVSVLTTKGKESFQISTGMDLTDFLFFGGESRAIAISAADAQLIRVSKN